MNELAGCIFSFADNPLFDCGGAHGKRASGFELASKVPARRDPSSIAPSIMAVGRPERAGDRRVGATGLDAIIARSRHQRSHPSAASAVVRDQRPLYGWFVETGPGPMRAPGIEVGSPAETTR